MQEIEDGEIHILSKSKNEGSILYIDLDQKSINTKNTSKLSKNSNTFEKEKNINMEELSNKYFDDITNCNDNNDNNNPNDIRLDEDGIKNHESEIEKVDVEVKEIINDAISNITDNNVNINIGTETDIDNTIEEIEHSNNKKSLSKHSNKSTDSKKSISPVNNIYKRKKDINFPDIKFTPYITKEMIIDKASIGDYFTCFLCESILHNPYYEIVEEKAVNYCKVCIDNWMNIHGEISPYTLNNELKSLQLQKNMINSDYLLNIKIKCYYDQCGWRGKVKHYKDHKNQCHYEEISCNNNHEGCITRVRRRSMNNHLKTCEYRFIECNHCKMEICSKRMDTHLETCPNVTINCHLCEEKFERKDKPKHEEVCLKMPVICEFRDWGCKDLIIREKKTQHNLDFLNQHLIMMQEKKDEVEKENFKNRLAQLLEKNELMEKKIQEYDIKLQEHENLIKSIRNLDEKIKDCIISNSNIILKDGCNSINDLVLNETISTKLTSKYKDIFNFRAIIDFTKSDSQSFNEDKFICMYSTGIEGSGNGNILFLKDECFEISILINSLKSDFIGVGYCDYVKIKNQNQNKNEGKHNFNLKNLKNKDNGLFIFCSNGDRYVNGETKNSFYGFKEKDKVHIRNDNEKKRIYFKTDENEAIIIDYNSKKNSTTKLTPCLLFSNLENDQITLLKVLKTND